MKTLFNKKLTIAFAVALLCITSVKAQIPEQLKSLPAFKLRVAILSSLNKPHTLHKLNDMRYSNNAPCLKKQNTLGGTNLDFGAKIVPTKDGGFAVCGGTYSGDGDFKVPVTNSEDAFIAKYNNKRQLEWTKTAGGTSDEYFNDIYQTCDGGYIAAGYTSSVDGDVSGNHGVVDAWIVKFSSSGNIEWQKCFGGSGVDLGDGIIQTFYGGYVFCGFTNSTDGDVKNNHGDFDAWVVQLTPKGNLLTQHCYGGSGFDAFYTVIQSEYGYVFQGDDQSNDGDVTGNHGIQDVWVVKTNSLGKILWQRAVGGSDYDGASNSIAKTTDGNIVIGGGSSSVDGDINAKDTLVSFLTKLNSKTGDIIWSKSYDKPGGRAGFGVFATSDGGVVETAIFGTLNQPQTFDALISKINTNGNEEWRKPLGGSDYDIAFNGGYEGVNHSLNIMCLTASTNGDVKNNHGAVDTWLIKLGHCAEDLNDDNNSPDDAIALTKINSTILSAYPNPVSNSATISFNLQQSQKVSISIYDMNGRLIKTLTNEQMQVGSHQLIWNARDEKGNAIVTGIYLLKMQAGNYVETKKISVVKK